MTESLQTPDFAHTWLLGVDDTRSRVTPANHRVSLEGRPTPNVVDAPDTADGAAPVRHRLEDRRRALELHREGLGYKRIARELGVGKTTVRHWIKPDAAERDRQVSREAKRRRHGICERCGGATNYNGRKGQPLCRYCGPCGKIVAAEAKRARAGTGPIQQRLYAFCDWPRRFSEIPAGVGISLDHAKALVGREYKLGRLIRLSRGVYVAAPGLSPDKETGSSVG